MPYSSISKPCIVAASPCTLLEYMLKGMTPGAFCLMARAAVSTSAQVLGSHGTWMPALAKTSLLYQSPRVSVPIGTP